jgi:hypothetical protein
VGNGHAYQIDGKYAPGVTTVLNRTVPKDALVPWAAGAVAGWVADRLTLSSGTLTGDAALLLDELAREAAEQRKPLRPGNRDDVRKVLAGLPDRDRDTAARRGTDVHEIANRLIVGEHVDVPEPLLQHVDNYLRWVAEWMPTDEIAEATVVSREPRYCGTFDLIATLVDGQRWLLDLKTNRTKVYPEVALQLAGYRYATTLLEPDGTESPMPHVDATGVVWLTGARYEFRPVQTGTPQWQAFRRCVAMAAYLHDTKDSVIGEPLELVTT